MSSAQSEVSTLSRISEITNETDATRFKASSSLPPAQIHVTLSCKMYKRAPRSSDTSLSARNRFHRPWKELYQVRYLDLNATLLTLTYSGDPTRKMKIATIGLETLVLVTTVPEDTMEQSPTAWVINVKTTERLYTFCCFTESEHGEWVRALSGILQQLQSRPKASPPKAHTRLRILNIKTAFDHTQNPQAALTRHTLIRCFAANFCNEEVLGRAAGVSFEEMKAFAGAFLEQCSMEGMSYVVVDWKWRAVGFLLIEDVSDLSQATKDSGIEALVEASCAPSLGKVFGALEEMHAVFLKKIGKEDVQRGEYFHVIATGAYQEVRSTGILTAMVSRAVCDLVFNSSKPYTGFVAEATGYASQAVTKKVVLPDFSFNLEKNYSDFKDELGRPLFPTAQTSHLVLWHQWAPSMGTLERDYQTANFFAGSFPLALDEALTVSHKLRLLALHSCCTDYKIRPPSRNIVDFLPQAAKYRATQNLIGEKKTRSEMRGEFVEIIRLAFPDYKERLAGLEDIEIERSVQQKVAEHDHDRDVLDYTRLFVPDKYARTCLRCTGAFTVIKRKHHCRICGNVVCGACSKNRMRMPDVLKVPGMRRACDVCFAASNPVGDELYAKMAGNGAAPVETAGSPRGDAGENRGARARSRSNSRREIRRETQDSERERVMTSEEIDKDEEAPAVPERPAAGFKKKNSPESI